jgi:tRNA A37 threonylcarbamoyladenosine modification protein TsaB|tara:strand:+ start:504 stop:845 length:342 start_codon:yes stop_codon:yes gene_type:complete
MIIVNGNNYNVSHENSKKNYERLIILLNDFLMSKNLDLKKISDIYINRGPGSFAGIRNSLSVVKAIHLVNKIDYYCFSFRDFNGEKLIKYEFIPDLCKKFKVEKNLINPIYSG